MPNQPKTEAHTVRVEAALWDAARARARQRDETVSAAVRAFLVTYTAPEEGA